MAVTATPKSCSIIIEVENDVASDGSTIYAQRTIGRIDPALADEKAFEFAAAVGTLQAYPVGDILRSNKVILSRA
jgi:hypothetical protein